MNGWLKKYISAIIQVIVIMVALVVGFTVVRIDVSYLKVKVDKIENKVENQSEQINDISIDVAVLKSQMKTHKEVTE